MRILTLGIIFFVLVASICVSQAVEPKLLWSYKPDASRYFADVAVTADGEYVAAGSSGWDIDDVDKVYFFNREGKLLWNYKLSELCSCEHLSISADGEYIAASTAFRWSRRTHDDVYFFNRKGKLLWSHAIRHRRGTIGSSVVAVSADGEYVAVGNGNSNIAYPDDDPTIYFFSREGELLWSYKTYFGVYGVAISADGEYIVAGSGGRGTSDWMKQFEPIGNIYFFNRAGELLWIYNNPDFAKYGFIEQIAISADGEYIAAGSEEGPKSKVYFLNRTGKLLWSYKMGGSVRSLSMSADGEYIAVGDSNEPHSKVYFLNRTGGLLWSSELFRRETDVSVSADGEYIAAGRPSLNDNLYFFNRAGELLWSYEMEDYYKGISISGDGKYVVTRYCDEVYFIDSGVITTPSPTSTPEHYEAIFAISGLLTVAYLLLRRKRDRAKRG